MFQIRSSTSRGRAERKIAPLSPLIGTGAQIALIRHERWNGTGDPKAPSGDEIPLPGRIAALAEVHDALTFWRSRHRG